MQPGNEYTLVHLRLLADLTSQIDSWPAEVVSLECLYEHFGHWSVTVRRKGQRTRFAFDARDRLLSAERLPRDGGDFATAEFEALALPAGLTEASLPAIVKFVREHAS